MNVLGFFRAHLGLEPLDDGGWAFHPPLWFDLLVLAIGFLLGMALIR